MSSTRRIITLIVALAAAACFALAVQGGQWWTVGEHSIGTTASRQCFGDDACRGASMAWTGGSDLWLRAGYATKAAGTIAMLVMLALAGALAAKRGGKLAAQMALIATMTAIVAGGLFQQYRPSMPGMEVARGTYLFGVAIIAALGAAIATLRAPQAPPP